MTKKNNIFAPRIRIFNYKFVNFRAVLCVGEAFFDYIDWILSRLKLMKV